ncbi:7246_t:CDS:2 [Acaulospora colombiana]|uniref:7246_t:CDS:1 n=1 Tax=Acaulospora colombiana TaxID=27376 RepID=A0ACA9LZ26_9GLOM|nr:7246_t:CDS:2 [Acaulospora colombiana]
MSAVSPSSSTSPKELITHDLRTMEKKKESIDGDSTPDRKISTTPPSENFEITTSPVPLTPKEKQEQPYSNSNESKNDNTIPKNDSESNLGIRIEGQGFFSIFDGHAGKQAAEWCGNHFHKTFQEVLREHPDLPIPEVFHLAFLQADKQLNQNAGKHSGCTAISAFLRSEEVPEVDDDVNNNKESATSNGTGSKKVKRVLYTANVGDARAVLSRNGKAVRLSYDHKGSDPQEAKRIVDAGGFVMNNRVNVTRSLGDSSMKEFVIGNPYTAEIVLTEKDSFLILACDGLWDVCDDQSAVDLIKDVTDPQLASKTLTEHALQKFSTDNLSVMVVRFING